MIFGLPEGGEEAALLFDLQVELGHEVRCFDLETRENRRKASQKKVRQPKVHHYQMLESLPPKK